MARLLISERSTDNQWVTEVTAEVRIGRRPDNDLVLATPGVSRHHALIVRDTDQDFIIDKSSGNGTFLNGRRLKSETKYPLREGDIVTIDIYQIKYQSGEGKFKEALEEGTESDSIEVRLLKKVLKSIDEDSMPSIEVLSGKYEGKKIYLPDDVPEISIGRDESCQLSLPDETIISRKHSKVIRRWGGIAIRDLESKNGTIINNKQVVEEYLHDGDRITLGTVVLIFRNPQELNIEEWEEFKPKAAPAYVDPKEIPLAEEAAEPEAEEVPEEEIEEGEQSLGEEAQQIEEEQAAIVAEEAESAPATPYPAPQRPKTKLSPMEIGMMGLGAAVILFSIVMIANLMFD